MSGGFSVEPESLRRGGEALQRVGDDFAVQLDGFDATLASYGTPWGGDEIGALIGQAYQAAVGYAMDCFYIAADEMAAAGEDLTVMAAAYDDTEKQNEDRFTGMSRGL
ncbi:MULTISPECIES: WXG100 family type VII secretion target [Catenuloplanes]|uniref:Excreted virulence factor EspC (Type VII ESX diderm) n=1 Tax=Catenuloplanes niger TaxID=587534 RepID=A0AAE3ZYJ6_9ACTN|nr:hypothetical protein [Catenuloplanes niger]MDR7327609.1 hypothetical protein [Catenuloplanes niger]